MIHRQPELGDQLLINLLNVNLTHIFVSLAEHSPMPFLLFALLAASGHLAPLLINNLLQLLNPLFQIKSLRSHLLNRLLHTLDDVFQVLLLFI